MFRKKQRRTDGVKYRLNKASVVGLTRPFPQILSFKCFLLCLILDESSVTPVVGKVFEIPVLMVGTETTPEDRVAPRFVKKLKNCQVFENGSVNLEVVVEGLPKPEVEWEFEGKPLEENDRVFTENEGNVFRFVCPECLYQTNFISRTTILDQNSCLNFR